MLAAPLVRAVTLYRDETAFSRHGAVHPYAGSHYMPGQVPVEQAAALIARVPIEVARDSIVSGSLDDVRERLAAYEEVGCDHLILYDIGRYLGVDGVARSRSCLAALARGRSGRLA